MIYLYLNVVTLQLLARSQIFFHSIVLCSYATVYFCTIKVGQQTKTTYVHFSSSRTCAIMWWQRKKTPFFMSYWIFKDDSRPITLNSKKSYDNFPICIIHQFVTRCQKLGHWSIVHENKCSRPENYCKCMKLRLGLKYSPKILYVQD